MHELANISLFESISNGTQSSISVFNLAPEKHGNLVIRRIQPQEIRQVSIVREHCCGDGKKSKEIRDEEPFLREQITKYPENKILVGAFDGTKLAGYVEFEVKPEGWGYSDIEWDMAAVLPKYRGCGLQRLLFNYAKQLFGSKLKTIGAAVSQTNTACKKNLSRLGFGVGKKGIFEAADTREKMDLLVKKLGNGQAR